MGRGTYYKPLADLGEWDRLTTLRTLDDADDDLFNEDSQLDITALNFGNVIRFKASRGQHYWLGKYQLATPLLLAPAYLSLSCLRRSAGDGGFS